MSLPNYKPSGTVLFGSVPWDNGYSHVRLYTSLNEQYEDIASRMVERSDNYAYIGRNRRLKVSIEADKLYHCNYCMYRNDSLTTGWIYCFITDVKYVNDNTTEVAIETDVFHTFLYGVDWTIPPCFIERETVPSELSKYLLTDEPSFPLIYIVDEQEWERFGNGGAVIMTTAEPEYDSSILQAIINPEGYYAKPVDSEWTRGIANGAKFYYVAPGSNANEILQTFLTHMTQTGSIDAIVAIFSIPDFAKPSDTSPHFLDFGADQYALGNVQHSFNAPARGTSLDGYTPKNRKLLYYPYTLCRLTDFNGQQSELRYELMDSRTIDIKYHISPVCQALVYPDSYRGIRDLDSGMAVSCGAQGSWNSNAFTTWLAQNAVPIAIGVAGIALAGVSGGTSLAAESTLLAEANTLRNAGLPAFAGLAEGDAALQAANARNMLKYAGGGAAAGAATMGMQAKQPTTTRGSINYNVPWATGVQGVAAQKVCVKAEVAQQIDEFFDRWGYAVSRIEAVNITSRACWNYVKTSGAAPKSLNVGAGDNAPFTRGHGTPASALDVIRRAFDGGVTFWHTTSDFGDYSLDNSL